MLVPKAQELVASPCRCDGSREKAQRFFEEGLGKAFARMREMQHRAYPLTLFYAFKQAETNANDDSKSSNVTISTGWETMPEGLIRAGFLITGTWPMRSELSNRMIAAGTNPLASSVVLACRLRPDDALLATRREFVETLRSELPAALKTLQHGSIAPVDLAQAAIGPGMAVFSRYSKVLDPDGSQMLVRAALGLINQALDEILAEQKSECESETRRALAWFEQNASGEGKFGDAEMLSRAKDTAVNALEEAGNGRGCAAGILASSSDVSIQSLDSFLASVASRSVSLLSSTAIPMLSAPHPTRGEVRSSPSAGFECCGSSTTRSKRISQA
jgi:putative DNA methylase